MGRLLHNAQCPEAGGRWVGYALFQQIVSDVVNEFRLDIGDVIFGDSHARLRETTSQLA